jgi:virginiamycin B lyase
MPGKSGSTFAVAVAVVAAVFCAGLIRAADIVGSLQGVVKSASGEALSGAYVKLTNAERGLTFMVISQAQGRYTATQLPPGKYTVQGIGNGYQSKSTPADVSLGKPATVDLSLTTPQGPAVPNGWPGTPGIVGGTEVQWKLPQPKLPEGAGKPILQTKCAQCHDLYRVSLIRQTRARWESTVEEMRERIQADPTRAKDLTAEEAKLLVDYLAEYYSHDSAGANAKPDPNGRLPRTLLTGEAARYIAVDFEIPIPDTDPHDITVDPRGNAWVNYRGGCCLGKFDPRTYIYTVVHPPAQERTRMGPPAQGLGDSIWMSDGGKNRRWLQLDSKTGEFNAFPAPSTLTGNVGGNTMRVHPDGKTVYSSNDNRILRLNIATREFTAFDIPSWIATKKRADSYGMAISGDGKVWFAEKFGELIGRLDPATGKIDEFKIPGFKKPGDFDNPRRMGADAAGNIWIALHETGKLLKIDYKTTEMALITPPTEKNGMYAVTADLKRNVIWFTEQASDKIGRYDPKTETWTEFSLPIIESDVRRIEVDPTNPSRIWWSGDTSNHLGYIEVLDR